MFDATHEVLNNDRVHKYTVLRDGNRICYSDALALWECDREFRSFFSSLLCESPFSAFRWETPAITIDSAVRDFEFVLLNSPGLARTPDAKTYADYFTTQDTNDGVIVFENLGKDATLVVPSPRGLGASYVHLAAFMRGAPELQKHALWRTVGQTVRQQLTSRPLWVSTAGGGVAWLHVRLDSRPKYYGYRPYKMQK